MAGGWSGRDALTMLGALAIVIALAGCDTAPNSHAIYLERLASVLESAIEPAAATPLRLFPAPNTLIIERSAEKIDLLDFLQVTRCDMGALVGARNSSLGRVKTASQRWLYDTALVQGLRAFWLPTAWPLTLGAQRSLHRHLRLQSRERFKSIGI